MKRNRDDGDEVVRAVQLVCTRSVPRTQVEGLSLTPLEKQVVSMKQAIAPHVILLVACGYRVRIFGRDSHVVSRRCGIMCIPGQPFEYSSIPYVRVSLYIHRLVSMGYHVAFADQESAAVRAASGTKSGIFTRAISRWYSRGTLLPSERVHTNGDVASDAAKTGSTTRSSASGPAAAARKTGRTEAQTTAAPASADAGEDGEDADGEEADAELEEEEGHETLGAAVTAASGAAPGFPRTARPRAVDASESFLCFLQLPGSSAAAAAKRGNEVVVEADAEEDANSVVSVGSAELSLTAPAVGEVCEALLVSFVTQRRLTLTLATALDLEDALQRYDIAELVLVCPSVHLPPVRSRPSRGGAQTSTTLLSASPTSGSLAYVAAAEALARVPEAKLRVLQSSLSLHLGPTITGEEDGKSTSVCAVCVPPHMTTSSSLLSVLDQVASLYLKPYELDSVYQRLLERTAQRTASTDNNNNNNNNNSTKTGAEASADAALNTQSTEAVSLVPPTMHLSGATLRALDLFHSSIGPTGSLLHLLDHSLTACGGRRLRAWLAAPLSCLSAIHARQACVAYLLHGQDGGFVEDVLRECNRIGDVEATIGKLLAQRCTVPEYLRLLRTTRAIHLLALEMIGGAPDEAAVGSGPPPLLRALLDTVCAPPAIAFMRAHTWEMDSTCQTPLELLSGLQAQESASASSSSSSSTASPSMQQMQQLLEERDAATKALDDELDDARRVLKMPGLQFQSIAGTAFLLDLPKAKADHAPASWLVVSRTKSNVRYHTPGVVAAQVRLCAANERLVGVAASEWQQRQTALSETRESMRVLAAVVELVGTLDALRSLALTSQSSGYVKPTMVAHPHTQTTAQPVPDKAAPTVEPTAEVCIRDGRHPVLDALLQHQYVACDVDIAPGQVWLLTGPNMGGKSALMRMVATFTVLAQMGCYVPARAATLPVFSGVYCRMGATDAILEGSSTFLMEMEETSRILSAPGLSSALVLMDELGRGTSSFDGAAVADATLSYLVARACTSIFVTHYNYLCDPWMRQAALTVARGGVPSVSCFYMGFRRTTATEAAESETKHATSGLPKKSLIFTYKPCPGVTPSSFGVEVAQMAGLPESVLATAKTMSEKAEHALQARLDIAELSRFVKSDTA